VIVSRLASDLLNRVNEFLGPDFNKIAGSDLDGDGYFVSYILLEFFYVIGYLKKGLLG